MIQIDERIRKIGTIEAMMRRPELGSIFGLIIVVIAYMLLTGPINEMAGHKNTFLDMWGSPLGVQAWVELTAYIGIIGISAAFLMISGEFDLSIGANVALGGHTLAMMVLAGVPLPLAIVVSLLFLAAVGMMTGLLVVTTGLPSFIVTLGFWFANRGFANYLAFRVHDTSRLDIKTHLEGSKVLQDGKVIELPDPTRLDNVIAFKDGFFGIDVSWLLFNAEVYYFIIIAAVAIFILNYSKIGNWIFASGGDPVAARAVGVPVAGVKVGLFMTSAILSGFLGVIFVLSSGVSDPLAGDFRELHAIAAAVIGGCALTGGYGTIVGVIMGSLIFSIVQVGIRFVPLIDNNLFRVIVGLMLLSSALLNQFIRNRVVKG